MAIAMAQLGGMAIIHKNLSVEDQAIEVKKVKRSESGMIINPHNPQSRKHHRGGHPAGQGERHIGIADHRRSGETDRPLTNRDLRFATNFEERIRNVMKSKGLITARESITMEEAKRLLHLNRIEKLPVIDGNNRLLGLITYKDILKTEKFPGASKDKMGRLMVGAAVGTSPDTMERVDALMEAKVDAIVVDTSHAHSLKVLNTIERIRGRISGIDIVAGNVATAQAARALLKAGWTLSKSASDRGRSARPGSSRAWAFPRSPRFWRFPGPSPDECR